MLGRFAYSAKPLTFVSGANHGWQLSPPSIDYAFMRNQRFLIPRVSPSLTFRREEALQTEDRTRPNSSPQQTPKGRLCRILRSLCATSRMRHNLRPDIVIYFHHLTLPYSSYMGTIRLGQVLILKS
jgi:hypothetical protein